MKAGCFDLRGLILVATILLTSKVVATVHTVNYSPPLSKTQVSSATAFKFDFDGDSISDMSFWMIKNSNFPGIVDWYINMTNGAEFVCSSGDATTFDCGDTIGVSAYWAKVCGVTSFWDSLTSNVIIDEHVMFRIPKANLFLYGWLHYSYNTYLKTVYIHGYGYNDSPSNSPNIYAGEEGCFTNVENILHTADLFSITPIPVSSYFTIKINETQTGSQLILTDLSGRMVFNSEVSNSKSEMDIAALPAGVYLATLISPNGQRATRKIIKQ